ncbi:hypothetical protein P7C73_g4435, partial [Tremellales sp. Uapishka_1]
MPIVSRTVRRTLASRRAEKRVTYHLAQSTDADAFIPQRSAAFSPQPDAGKAALIQKTRDQSLADAHRRAEGTGGSGKLTGKVGVITGVGPAIGIGAAAARLFAREGAKHLYLLDYSDAHLSTFTDSLRKTFPSVKFTNIKADAASSTAIEELVAGVLQEEGHLDFFFANAGIVAPPLAKAESSSAGDNILRDLQYAARNVDQIPGEEFVEVMRVNALSAFLAVKYASVAMAKTCPDGGKTIPGGSIILTASIAGLKANAGPTPYSASKAAVASIAQTSAYALTGQNVRVNAVCPGLIQTDMTRAAFDLAEKVGKQDKIGTLNPLLRQGLGAEVAQLALFLASDDSSYVNGQQIGVDGGLTAGVPFIRPKL